MRFLLLSLFLLGELAVAQDRYLVSPNDDWIPLRKGESAKAKLAATLEKSKRIAQSTSAICDNQATFGATPDLFPTNINHVARHKDVMGMWFVAKATGTIDTIFWNTLSDVGAKDSMIYLRVHRSVIGPTAGPGIRPGPYNPPCQNWGYWVNTNDADQGVAAFPEDYTDSTWHSTYNGPVSTFPPFDSSLWGFTGYGVIDHLGINSVAMMQIGIPLPVTTGDKFFVSMRVNGPAGHPSYTEAWTSWATTSFRVDPTDEYYPSRNWKFYEHDSGPSNCAGVPVNLVKRGWVARGGFLDANDSLDVGLLNWWYTMTVTSNVPPVVQSMTTLANTFETNDHLIEATITDCNPENPSGAGVATAVLRWQTIAPGTTIPVVQTDIPLSSVGGDSWEATLPGKPVGTTVTYKIIASDSDAVTANGPPVTFRIVQLSNSYYYADTGTACSPKSIAATGTLIPKSAMYLPPGAAETAVGPDDGSWGPIDLGGDMIFFGDAKRYAWVGVDGGMALSTGSADTIDVNSNGLYTTAWSLPEQPMRHGGRSDTTGLGRIPNGFIAPLWSDLWYGDSVTSCGGIRYQLGFGGDTCLVIVEWDSIGAFADLGGSTCDNTTFRVCLNKCDGTIEFQYDDIGDLGLDSNAVVGMQDSSAVTAPYAGFEFVNEYTFPYETKPRNNWCITFYPATIVNALNGWNLLSVGVTPVGGNFATGNVFPGAVGTVYGYSGTYTPVTTTSNGPGYWAKFPAGTISVGARGALVSGVSASVASGWNLVGAAGRSVPTASVVQTPPAIVSSNYFDYGAGGYGIVSALIPGKGHWVKTTAGGSLGISVGAAPGKRSPSTNLAELTVITVTDAAGRSQTLYCGSDANVAEALSFYELPPAAPEFDARFASGRMLETYPALLDARASYDYPIAFEGTYPLKISWNVRDKGHQLLLSTESASTVMNGSGHVTIQDAAVKSATVRVTEAGALPKEFALGQNYPNPFNPSTRFEVEVAKSGLVSVKIYDILGRMVADLMEETKEPGVYNITWDADNFPTGVYFAKMTAGEFTASRKLMLLK